MRKLYLCCKTARASYLDKQFAGKGYDFLQLPNQGNSRGVLFSNMHFLFHPEGWPTNLPNWLGVRVVAFGRKGLFFLKRVSYSLYHLVWRVPFLIICTFPKTLFSYCHIWYYPVKWVYCVITRIWFSWGCRPCPKPRPGTLTPRSGPQFLWNRGRTCAAILNARPSMALDMLDFEFDLLDLIQLVRIKSWIPIPDQGLYFGLFEKWSWSGVSLPSIIMEAASGRLLHYSGGPPSAAPHCSGAHNGGWKTNWSLNETTFQIIQK